MFESISNKTWLHANLTVSENSRLKYAPHIEIQSEKLKLMAVCIFLMGEEPQEATTPFAGVSLLPHF